MKTPYKTVLVCTLVIGIFFAVSELNQRAAAQEATSTMQMLLESLRDKNTTVTFEFVKPLVSGEATWTLPSETHKIGEVGADYVCFSEPWNDSVRNRCTPFANLVTINFVK